MNVECAGKEGLRRGWDYWVNLCLSDNGLNIMVVSIGVLGNTLGKVFSKLAKEGLNSFDNSLQVRSKLSRGLRLYCTNRSGEHSWTFSFIQPFQQPRRTSMTFTVSTDETLSCPR